MVIIQRLCLLCITSLILLTSCSQQKPQLQLEPVNFTDLSGWYHDTTKDALKAFRRSCKKMMKLPPSHKIKPSSLAGSASTWQDVCARIPSQTASDYEARRFFEHEFLPYRVLANKSNQGLFTGYYEIGLKGSYAPSSEYRFPLYRKPKNLEAGAPYLSRAAINQGSLAGKQLEILYVNDPVRSFFLHIQGSGRVSLPNNEVVRVSYAGKNGHAYHSLGKKMIEANLLAPEDVSASSIRMWLYRYIEHAQPLMEENPSYIFFRTHQQPGPIGAQGVPLVPERSLAIDKSLIPYGAPIWLETTYPEVPGDDTKKPFHKLLIAQDTGGAIKGAIRGDIFFGHGEKAEQWASYMKEQGSYFVLLPRALASRTTL